MHEFAEVKCSWNQTLIKTTVSAIMHAEFRLLEHTVLLTRVLFNSLAIRRKRNVFAQKELFLLFPFCVFRVIILQREDFLKKFILRRCSVIKNWTSYHVSKSVNTYENIFLQFVKGEKGAPGPTGPKGIGIRVCFIFSLIVL